MSQEATPYVVELGRSVRPVEVFQQLAGLPHLAFFDSASPGPGEGVYSFVAADPYEWIESPGGEQTAFDQIVQAAGERQALSIPGLPPFQGGLAGLCGYELGQLWEPTPTAQYDDLPTPRLAMGWYDVVVAFDHRQELAWLISQGFPEVDPQARRRRAEERARQFLTRLEATAQSPAGPAPPTPVDTVAPRYDVDVAGVVSDLSPDGYRAMVQRGIEYIHAGDIFQVNLSQRLLCPATCPSLELYLRLRKRNPAPYAGYLDLGETQICSASPECFLTIRGGQIETRPIKGTRGRSSYAEADLFAGDELLDSEKDRAENVMIVDLMRNDLSRVCEADSVHVAQLCQLETYAYVKHLTSVVRGQLRSDCTPLDALRAAFPGGSITGAPKVRAMQIIAELEPTARGAYCGSLVYLGYDGQMDASILIRTVTAAGGWWQLPVGGGIVAQSDPDEEYRETWHKARGLLAACRP